MSKQMKKYHSHSSQLLSECDLIQQYIADDVIFVILGYSGELLWKELILHLESVGSDIEEDNDEDDNEDDDEDESDSDTDDDKEESTSETSTSNDTDSDEQEEDDDDDDEDDDDEDDDDDDDDDEEEDEDDDGTEADDEDDDEDEEDEENEEDEEDEEDDSSSSDDEADDDEWKLIKKYLRENEQYTHIINLEVDELEYFSLCLKPIIERKRNIEISINDNTNMNILCIVRSYSKATSTKLKFAYSQMMEDEDHDNVCVFKHRSSDWFNRKDSWQYVDDDQVFLYKTIITLEEIIPIKHKKTGQQFWYLELKAYDGSWFKGKIFCIVEINDIE